MQMMDLLLLGIKRSIVFFIVFSYLYSISYFFLPFNFPFIMGFVGIIVFLFNRKDSIRYRGTITCFFKLLSLPLFIAVLSVLINLSFDFDFVKLQITNYFYLFGAYLLIKTMRWGERTITPTTVINYFIVAAVVQCIITLMMFMNPSLANSLQALLQYNDIATQSLDRTEGTRLIGFGAYFFSSGLIHGFVLLLIVTRILLNKKNNVWTISILLFFWAFIVIVGAMLARTTLVGAAISMALLVYILLFKKSFVSKRKLFLGFLLPLGMVLFVIMRFDSISFLGDFDAVMHFGFEMFYNYENTGSLGTSSSNGMFENMLVFPDNFSTWLIGDGRWVDPSNPYKYYMHTDIGYSRLLFHSGLTGLLFFFMYQYKMIKRTVNCAGFPYYIIVLFIIYMLVLNVKGFTDLLLYLAPFAFLLVTQNARKIVFQVGVSQKC